MKQIPHNELLPEIAKYIDVINDGDNDNRYYLLAIDSDMKRPFAEWVVREAEQDNEILSVLKPIIDGLKQLLLHVPHDGCIE